MLNKRSTPLPLPNIQVAAGLILVGVTWLLTWLPEFTDHPTTLRNHLLFFPLWLGYILVMDFLVYRRKGSSLLWRDWRAFVGLFVVSAPAWWIFEVLNWRTRNWEYLGRDHFTDLEYFLLASIAFSTVIPAVFETAEWVSTFNWLKRIPRRFAIPQTPPVLLGFFMLGILALGLMLVIPRYFFPLIWVAPFLLLSPTNAWLKNRSLSDYTATGDWRPVIALFVGTLICGFFWEMWNFYGYPKWVYHVPFVGVLHVFEMPLLGYGGYLPFGLELFAIYHFVIGWVHPAWRNYVEIGG